MKKLISFVLALVIMVTAVPTLLVTAEDDTPAFVVDGWWINGTVMTNGQN